jgi:LysR family positive regulator for ilvC
MLRNTQQGARMDMQELEIFVKTAEMLHFGRASQASNLSPSALTRTIQRLEEELGKPLFLRDNRSVALTEAGRQLLTYARSATRDWQQFRESIAAERDVLGTLSIYASITAVYGLLPDLLAAFRSAHPKVHLELRTGAAEHAIEQVLSGEIDLAVAALPDQKQARLEFMPLVETPLVFIRPKSPTFAVPESDQPFDVASVPLVVPQSGPARHRLNVWLRAHDITPNIALEVSGNEALIAMVRLGTGIGVTPQLALERSPFRDDVDVICGAPELDPYVVGLCANKRNLKRRTVDAMWNLARDL